MTTDPRTQRAVRGVLAGSLGLEALMVLFVPRAVAQVGSGLTGVKLGLLIALFVALVAAAALVPRPVGIVLGSVLQFAVIACGVMTSAMYVLGVIFGAIWLYELHVRSTLLR
ncbi:MAG: DUF4233 domain-containing protein [Mycobacteriales bacterium]